MAETTKRRVFIPIGILAGLVLGVVLDRLMQTEGTMILAGLILGGVWDGLALAMRYNDRRRDRGEIADNSRDSDGGAGVAYWGGGHHGNGGHDGGYDGGGSDGGGGDGGGGGD